MSILTRSSERIFIPTRYTDGKMFCTHWFIGPVLDKDMQTPPHPPFKKSRFAFWSKLLRNVLKRMKNEKKKLISFSVMTDFIHNFQVFLVQIRSKMMFYLGQKQIRNVIVGVFVFLSFYFVRFLVFELWSVLYLTVSWEPKNFANLIQTLTSSG